MVSDHRSLELHLLQARKEGPALHLSRFHPNRGSLSSRQLENLQTVAMLHQARRTWLQIHSSWRREVVKHVSRLAKGYIQVGTYLYISKNVYFLYSWWKANRTLVNQARERRRCSHISSCLQSLDVSNEYHGCAQGVRVQAGTNFGVSAMGDGDGWVWAGTRTTSRRFSLQGEIKRQANERSSFRSLSFLNNRLKARWMSSRQLWEEEPLVGHHWGIDSRHWGSPPVNSWPRGWRKQHYISDKQFHSAGCSVSFDASVLLP